MKHRMIVAGLLLLSATPSVAQETTSLQYVLSKGVVIHGGLYGRPVEMRVTYKGDGTSITNVMGQEGKGADLAGKWRIDGDKLCTANSMNPVETCFVVPPEKGPGDEFKLTTPGMGEVSITINK
jgi:hypothetical protein